MPVLAATNGRPEVGVCSAERRAMPNGSKSTVASETDDQRKAN